MIQFKTHSGNKTFTIETLETEDVMRFLVTWKNMLITHNAWSKYADRENIKYEIKDK